MSDTQEATQGGSRDARIIEEHQITGPHGEDEIEGTDLMGFNSKWWMAVGWLILLLVVLFQFPWWW